MVLPMVTAAVTLFYLGAIPLHIVFRLRIGSKNFFGLGISAFEPRFALRQSLESRQLGGHTSGIFKKLNTPDAVRSGLRTLRYAAKHIRMERICLDGRFGSHDAALTALVCGSATALGNALCCATGREIRFGLQPDFSDGSVRMELVGMISVRVGHIMLAALLGAFQYGSRRFKQWTDTPLKAS